MKIKDFVNISLLILLHAIGLCFTACGNGGKATAAGPSSEEPASKEHQDSMSHEQQSPLKENTIFAFVGDIMMGTNYPETPKGAYLPANNGADLFKDVRRILRGVNIAAGNLEGTLLDAGGTPKRCSNPAVCYAFRMPQKYVNNLVDAGFDFVSIANNHINDFGPTGVSSTERTLTGAGIKYAGLKGRCETATIERDGRKIGFVAFGHNRGTMSINEFAEMQRVVSRLKKNHDLVVVSFHGGAEGKGHSHVPHKTETAFGENRGDVEKFAHAAIDAGADVVYGHGPHVTRAAELYNGHLILYSLGNFCTPYRVSVGGISGYAPVVVATIDSDGKFVSGQIHSFIQQKGIGPRLDPTDAVAKNIRNLSQSDFPSSQLDIASDGTMTVRK